MINNGLTAKSNRFIKNRFITKHITEMIAVIIKNCLKNNLFPVFFNKNEAISNKGDAHKIFWLLTTALCSVPNHSNKTAKPTNPKIKKISLSRNR